MAREPTKRHKIGKKSQKQQKTSRKNLEKAQDQRRGNTKESAYELLSRALESLKQTAGPGDHLYESENDDL